MVAASPAAKGTRHESHGTSRAAALLGPLLYAAALSGGRMREVVACMLSGDVAVPAAVLDRAAELGDADAGLARMELRGVERAADQERQSIWSATADVIDTYTTADALDAAEDSDWTPATFVESSDTVYITAPAEHQAAVAPLVVALLEAVRDAAYRQHHHATLEGRRPGRPVSLVLDEVANVAPIASLPALVSEARGQGVRVIAAVQDLFQVRGRWGGEVADGFLSLYQHVLVLGGVRDWGSSSSTHRARARILLDERGACHAWRRVPHGPCTPGSMASSPSEAAARVRDPPRGAARQDLVPPSGCVPVGTALAAKAPQAPHDAAR